MAQINIYFYLHQWQFVIVMSVPVDKLTKLTVDLFQTFNCVAFCASYKPIQ